MSRALCAFPDCEWLRHHKSGYCGKHEQKRRRGTLVPPSLEDVCLPDERWVVVAEAPAYQVSDQGRLWSHTTQRLLKPWALSKGHLAIGLTTSEGVIKRLVHRLVLEAFVGPCPADQEGCHYDGNPANNVLSNLRWDTRSGNQRDTVRHGKHHWANKTHCPQGHEYTPENTSLRKNRRFCLICSRQRSRQLRARQKAESK